MKIVSVHTFPLDVRGRDTQSRPAMFPLYKTRRCGSAPVRYAMTFIKATLNASMSCFVPTVMRE